VEVTTGVGVGVYVGAKTGVKVKDNGVGENVDVASAGNGRLKTDLPDSRFTKTRNRTNNIAAIRKPAISNTTILFLENERTSDFFMVKDHGQIK